MPINLKAKKRLASRVTGVGIHRIKFDTDHLDDIADAMFNIINSIPMKEKIIQKGFENCKRYSWKKSAERILEIINKK